MIVKWGIKSKLRPLWDIKNAITRGLLVHPSPINHSTGTESASREEQERLNDDDQLFCNMSLIGITPLLLVAVQFHSNWFWVLVPSRHQTQPALKYLLTRPAEEEHESQVDKPAPKTTTAPLLVRLLRPVPDLDMGYSNYFYNLFPISRHGEECGRC